MSPALLQKPKNYYIKFGIVGWRMQLQIKCACPVVDFPIPVRQKGIL
jgi:hypothetical protein